MSWKRLFVGLQIALIALSMTPAWAEMISDGDMFEEGSEMLVEVTNDANDFPFRLNLINPGNDSINIFSLAIEGATAGMNNNPGILNVNWNLGIQNAQSNGFFIRFSVPAK